MNLSMVVILCRDAATTMLGMMLMLLVAKVALYHVCGLAQVGTIPWALDYFFFLSPNTD